MLLPMVSGCDKDEDYNFHVRVIDKQTSLPLSNLKVVVHEVESGFLSPGEVLNEYVGVTDSTGDCLLKVRFQRYDHIFFSIEVQGSYPDPKGSPEKYFMHFNANLKESDFKSIYYIRVE